MLTKGEENCVENRRHFLTFKLSMQSGIKAQSPQPDEGLRLSLSYQWYSSSLHCYIVLVTRFCNSNPSSQNQNHNYSASICFLVIISTIINMLTMLVIIFNQKRKMSKKRRFCNFKRNHQKRKMSKPRQFCNLKNKFFFTKSAEDGGWDPGSNPSLLLSRCFRFFFLHFKHFKKFCR